MSKKSNGGDFQNRAARRFKRIEKVDTMSQSEIFEILDEDISVILGQITQVRVNHGKYPQYLANAFANLSTPLWFAMYVDEHVKTKKKKGTIATDLSEEDIESLKYILADMYKKSATNFYPQQTQEFEERNKLLSKTFIKMVPDQVKLAKKLGLSKPKTRELLIQIYGNPVNNMRFVCKLFDSARSDISDKKKLKLMRKLYGKKRFVDAVGAAMTISKNDSDCIAMLFDYMRKLKTKKRAPYILAYVEAYKVNKTSNFRLSDPKFYKKNKKLFKELKHCDIGYKKAFKHLKPKDDDSRDRKSKGKKDII